MGHTPRSIIDEHFPSMEGCVKRWRTWEGRGILEDVRLAKQEKQSVSKLCDVNLFQQTRFRASVPGKSVLPCHYNTKKTTRLPERSYGIPHVRRNSLNPQNK